VRKTSRTDANLLFRAFSDETRVRLLNLMRGGEVCVCDLVDTLRIPQPTTSRHLATLRRAGLVAVRKDGLWSHYSLAPAGGKFHEKLLECLECCFDEVPELGADIARMQKVRKARGCCD
jgi:ArsR family transcriptional regulator, arsenate/arsenite/antimonite-responsive transcriptional repressor